jgi:hypothetical protein
MTGKGWILGAVLIVLGTVVGVPMLLVAAWPDFREEVRSLTACYQLGRSGLRPLAEEPADRFLGKVQEFTARCRGGNGRWSIAIPRGPTGRITGVPPMNSRFPIFGCFRSSVCRVSNAVSTGP